MLFIDDCGDVLALDGINFGYDGDTPNELLDLLHSEGFSRHHTEYAVLNPTGEHTYPITIPRD